MYLGEAAHVHVPEHVAALEGHAEQVGHVRAQRLHGGRAEGHVGQRDVVQGHGHREELREVAVVEAGHAVQMQRLQAHQMALQ